MTGRAAKSGSAVADGRGGRRFFGALLRSGGTRLGLALAQIVAQRLGEPLGAFLIHAARLGAPRAA